MSYIGLLGFARAETLSSVSNFVKISILVVSCISEAKILFLVAAKIFQMTVFGESQPSLVQGS